MSTFAFTHIAEELRSEIRAGTYPVGASLPSERELSRQFEVSPGTVRVALRTLVDEGTVDGSRGRPKRVVQLPRTQGSYEEFRSFAQWALQQGLRPGGRVLDSQWQIATQTDIDLLQTFPGRRILSVVRLRTLGGENVMLEHTHYPEWLGEIIENMPADIVSVTAALADEFNIHFSHAEHLFGAEGARSREAERLQISRGTALLVHRRISRDPSGRALEWSTDRYISGKITLSAGSSWHSSPLRWTMPSTEPCG